jgi:hypothetical protein
MPDELVAVANGLVISNGGDEAHIGARQYVVFKWACGKEIFFVFSR